MRQETPLETLEREQLQRRLMNQRGPQGPSIEVREGAPKWYDQASDAVCTIVKDTDATFMPALLRPENGA